MKIFEGNFNDFMMMCKALSSIEKVRMLIVCKEKKYVILKFGIFETKVECHADDEFDWKIGFGLAISKMFGECDEYKNAREYFRDKETRKLDYKEYAKWCVWNIYNKNLKVLKTIEEKVQEIEENGKVDL